MSRSNSFRSVAATALMVVTLLAASGAQATLLSRLNGQAVYDSDADLTWLQNANANAYNGYGGLMNWSTAMTWAAQLTIENVSHWRLPGGPMEGGRNKPGSEMGNLFFKVLGGTTVSGGTPSNANYAFFQNINAYFYWSGVATDYSAWGFNFNDGVSTSGGGEGYGMLAWAVHDGDVPAPGTLALLGAGLCGWAGVKRSRRGA